VKIRFLIWLVFIAPVAHAQLGSVVFGSYTQARYADEAIRRVGEQLDIRATTIRTEVAGNTYLRVVSPPMAETAGRSLIQRAIQEGFKGPWFLAEVAPKAHIVQTLGRTDTATSPAQTKPTKQAASEPKPTGATRPSKVRLIEPELTNQPNKVVVPTSQSTDIRIDGRVDESTWLGLPVYDNMLVSDPDTLAKPEFATHTRFFYTDKGLYVSAIMEQPVDSLVRRLSNRDEEVNRDSFGIALDTSGEGLYGYWFELGLGGSKADGKVAPERSITRQWDGAWTGETAITDDGWSAELFIPWAIMSMPNHPQERPLTFWVQRKVAHANEQYGWPALPRSSARFMSALQPMEVSGVNPRQQWEIFPYVSSTTDEIKGDSQSRAGIDVFWRPSSNFQITATANPDFGTVESDDVVVNLTAFETFFPEKRLFFLEGTEVFVTSPRSNPRFISSGSQGGRKAPPLYNMEPTTLLNTRRIGGAAKHIEIPDHVTVAGVEQSSPSELTGAVKLVGQAGGLRYGVLAAQEKNAALDGIDNLTGANVRLREDGRDFGVARLIYEDSSGTGRRSIGWMGTFTGYPQKDDAVVQGIDTHWLSATGKWSWDTQLVASDSDEEQGYGLWTDIGWTPRLGIGHQLSIDLLDDKLDLSDLGFLRRNDTTSFRYRYFTNTSKGLPSYLQRKSRGFFLSSGTNTDGYLARSFVGNFLTWVFSNNAELRGELDWMPAHYDDRNARGNGTYKTEHGYFFMASYGTDSSKKFSTSLQLGVRSEDLGDPQYLADLGFTWNPIDRFTFNLDLSWKQRNNWLIYVGDTNLTAFDAIELTPSMSMDFFITAKQHLRMTMQWAGINADESEYYRVPARPGDLLDRVKDPLEESGDFTISRLTAQLRYRWEIGPLSDLFVVYTRGSNLDNRIDEDFDVLFRDAVDEPIVDTLTVKLRYRFGS